MLATRLVTLEFSAVRLPPCEITLVAPVENLNSNKAAPTMRKFIWSNMAIAAAVVVVIPALLLYNGFCLKVFVYDNSWHHQARFLSNEQAINAAIYEVIENTSHFIVDRDGQKLRFTPKKQVRYQSRDEFRQLNPECCSIVPHDRFEVSLWHQLCGRAAKSVRIAYSIRYIDDDGKPSSASALVQYAITNCGHVMRR